MTEEMRSTAEIIGRDDINDLEAIMAVYNTDVDEELHTVHSKYDTVFTWDYDKEVTARSWTSSTKKPRRRSGTPRPSLPWETDVDQEAIVVANAVANGGFNEGIDVSHTPLAKWDDAEWVKFGVESQNWTLSQFMHSEQGALVCTAKIVESVPWIDAEVLRADLQVMDEARHVEGLRQVPRRQALRSLPDQRPHLRLLLDDIISDSRWDKRLILGMQIMVEGLALAAFGFMHQMTTEPLLKQLLRYVMSDESRHVAFGVLSLQEYYTQLSAGELRERRRVRLRGRCPHA